MLLLWFASCVHVKKKKKVVKDGEAGMIYYLIEEISYYRNYLHVAVILRPTSFNQESSEVCGCQLFKVH